MHRICTAFAELIGLFVDDGRFAGIIVIWLAICWLVLPHLVGTSIQGGLLALGLLGALIESTWRRTRR
jgi:hypothetical protein